MGEDAVLAAAAADAGYWSEDNAASQTVECELFIATRQDRQQRAKDQEAEALDGAARTALRRGGRLWPLGPGPLTLRTHGFGSITAAP